MVVYEPASLPFGGTYHGVKAFEQFYPKVRAFYDFTQFELQHVYADGDKIFAISKAAIAHTHDSISLCEEMTFSHGKIVEVRLCTSTIAAQCTSQSPTHIGDGAKLFGSLADPLPNPHVCIDMPRAFLGALVWISVSISIASAAPTGPVRSGPEGKRASTISPRSMPTSWRSIPPPSWRHSIVETSRRPAT